MLGLLVQDVKAAANQVGRAIKFIPLLGHLPERVRERERERQHDNNILRPFGLGWKPIETFPDTLGRRQPHRKLK